MDKRNIILQCCQWKCQQKHRTQPLFEKFLSVIKKKILMITYKFVLHINKITIN